MAPAAASRRSAPRRHSAETDAEELTVADNEHPIARAASTTAPPPSLAIAALEKKVQIKEAALEQTTRELSGLRDDYETLQAEFRYLNVNISHSRVAIFWHP